MVENKIYEKGTLGWLREQAKNDGFDSIRSWQNYQNQCNKLKNYQESIDQIKNIDQVKKILCEHKIDIEDKIVFCRFWEKVDIKDNTNDCWNWTACTNNGEYGEFRLNNNKVRSHRMSYILTKGPIPEELQIQHLCNNSKCCNPNHIELGNQSKNMQYRSECERYNNYGENNGYSKLTDDQIREIHKIYKERPGLRQWQIAKMFEISQPNLSCILNGKIWHHIYKEFHQK